LSAIVLVSYRSKPVKIGLVLEQVSTPFCSESEVLWFCFVCDHVKSKYKKLFYFTNSRGATGELQKIIFKGAVLVSRWRFRPERSVPLYFPEFGGRPPQDLASAVRLGPLSSSHFALIKFNLTSYYNVANA
jgi:hypothetical protein